MQKGYISEFMSGGRIVAHGKITDLTNGFSLPEKIPFTIYARPKYTLPLIDTVLSVKTYQNEDFDEAPFLSNDWSPLAIIEIAPDNSILEQYDLYWGSGSYVSET